MSQELILMFFGGVVFGLGIAAGIEPLELGKNFVPFCKSLKQKIKEKLT